MDSDLRFATTTVFWLGLLTLELLAWNQSSRFANIVVIGRVKLFSPVNHAIWS